MRILLTGSNGFLGRVIVNTLSSIVTLIKLSRNNSDINIDLSKNSPEINAVYDIVIHSAGLAHFFPNSDEETKLFNNVNVLGTLNLLNGLIKYPPKRFVFISSVSVYGLNKGEYISEDMPLIAKDPYGKSKIDAEEIVLRWCKQNNVICTIFRLPLVVGTNPPGNLRSMIHAIKKGFYFNISGGIARKSMVLASDIAEIIIKASEVGGIYNLTDGNHPSFAELSYYIAKQYNKSFVPSIPKFIAIILAFIGDRIDVNFPINSDKLKKITSTLTFDDSKARKEFGWNPTAVLERFKIQDDV